MPLSAGHAAAVQVIEDALKSARDNPQGVDNIHIVAEAIVDAIEKKLIPQGDVNGTTATYLGPQPLTGGKMS